MRLIRVSIDRPVFISMVALFLGVVGILALRTLPLDLYPSVTYPVLAVRSDLSGAAPEEIEEQITKKIEDTLSTLAGVKTMRSMSREGSSMVLLEFDLGADIRYQEMQARAKLSNMRRSLPAEMSEPVVFRQDPDESPIVEVALTGPLTAAELSSVAENSVVRRLRQLEGVGDIDISGSRSKEIQVNLRPQALDAFHLNAGDVVQAIQRSNRNDAVGRLEGDNFSWVARSVSQAVAEGDLGRITVGKSSQGHPIFVADVADVRTTFATVQRVSQIHDETGLHPAVVVSILKQSGENTVAVSDRIRAALDDIREQLPEGISLRISRDNADLVRVNVADVYESLLTAALLTIVVVLLFLGSHRSTLTTGLALPSSVITTFIVMKAAGFTINIMTLLALSLSIGLLVDDAIVVRENIFRHLRAGKLDGRQAAFRGANEVVLAVLATTLTVVAVFLPVAFMGGLTGQFFKSFALTVVFAMMVSLWDSLTMAPMLSAWYANIPDPAREWAAFGPAGRLLHRGLRLFESGFSLLERLYERILRFLLPRWWLATLVTLAAVLGAAWGFQTVKKTFLPTQLGDTFRVQLEGPLAVPVERIQETANEVDARIDRTGLFTWWTLSTGGGMGGNASINLSLRTRPEHAKSQDSLAGVRQKVRMVLQGLPGFNLRISEPADPLSGAGGGRFQPVAVTIEGEDFSQIRTLSQRVRAIMNDTPGIADVAPFQESGLPEVRFRTNPLAAAQHGVTPAVLSENLRIWVQGDTSNRLRVGDEQIPIRVALANGSRMSPQEILQRHVFLKGAGPNRSDVMLPLASVMSTETGAGPATISRENRRRTLRVGAGIERDAALGDVVRDLKERLRDLPLPSGYELRVVGQSEQMAEATQNILTAIGIGSIFVYMVLASLFESFLLPITVMAAIPLAATGAVLALLLFGIPLDLYGGIGMVLLAGIVAKNSILLVDFANSRVRERNMEPREAILESAPLRLRPILMTSVAMIVGMLPVALGWGSTGQARQGLGVSTIGGIVSSTFLTLLVVPNLFVFTQKLRSSLLHLFRRPGRSEEPQQNF